MKLVQADTVLATAVGDDEVVMMDADLARYFGLSATGPDVWAEFALPTTVADAVRRLEQRFEAPEGVIASEVMALVDSLTERRLLVESPT